MVRRLPVWMRAAVPLALVAGAGAMVWSRVQEPEIPDAFAWGTGGSRRPRSRIATKRTGRVVELRVDEGDTVETGQLVARLDADDLEAELRAAEASRNAADFERNQAIAVVAQRASEHALAGKEFARAAELSKQGLLAQQVFDQGQSRTQMTEAALQAAQAQQAHAEDLIRAATAQTGRFRAELADTRRPAR